MSLHSVSPSPVLASSPPSSPSSQPKKRTRVTPSQLAILEDTFIISATPDNKMRKQLSHKLHMSERSIQIWFQNRRAKVKMLQKRALMREEQEEAKARLYAQAAGYVHHQQPYWVPRRPLSAKVPIQRAWSSDILSVSSEHYHHQHPPPPPMPSFVPAPPFTSSTTLPFYSMHGGINGAIVPATPLLSGSAPVRNSIYHQDISSSPCTATAYSAASSTTTSATPSSHVPDNLHDIRFRRIDSGGGSSTPSLLASVRSSSSSNTANGASIMGFLSASALTIGTWHRMKITQQDLVCHFHAIDRTFSWHIRDSEYHFKMVILFDSVASIEMHHLSDSLSAEITIDLSEAPLFYMENSDKTWMQCSDFTEGMQATCILRHSIRGLISDLRQELFSIVSVDDALCQITQFDVVNTTDVTMVDQNLLTSWRHQSMPLTTDDFGWTHHEAAF